MLAPKFGRPVGGRAGDGIFDRHTCRSGDGRTGDAARDVDQQAAAVPAVARRSMGERRFDVAALRADTGDEERQRWRRLSTPAGDVRVLAPPVTIDEQPPRMDPVPALGEHTDEILQELGFPRDQIDAWRTGGTI